MSKKMPPDPHFTPLLVLIVVCLWLAAIGVALVLG